MPDNDQPYRPFLSPQKRSQKSSDRIVGTFEKGLQSAHQATVYHNFLFVHRHVISSFAPLFIAQLISLHPISALLALGVSAAALVFLVKKFMSGRLPSYEEYFQKFYWLFTFQNKRVHLNKKKEQQFRECLQQNENPIERIQNTLVINFINFTLTYLALSQIAHLVTSLFPVTFAPLGLYTEFFCGTAAVWIEQKKQQAQTRNQRHKTKLLALILYMQTAFLPYRKKVSVSTANMAKQTISTKLSWAYAVVGIALIGINLSYVNNLLLSRYLVTLLIIGIVVISALLLKSLFDRESVRIEVQTALTTYSAGHALMHLGKSKVLQFFPSLVEKAIPTVMARFLLTIISMYTFLLYLYHLTVKKEQQDTLLIHKTLSEQITPLEYAHLEDAKTYFNSAGIDTDHLHPHKEKDHDRTIPSP